MFVFDEEIMLSQKGITFLYVDLYGWEVLWVGCDHKEQKVVKCP